MYLFLPPPVISSFNSVGTNGGDELGYSEGGRRVVADDVEPDVAVDIMEWLDFVDLAVRKGNGEAS